MEHAIAGYWVKEWIVPISASVARSVYVKRNFDKFYMVIVGEKKKRKKKVNFNSDEL